MLYDRNDRNDLEFSKEVAGSLGAFATANQWSMENLAEKLRQKSYWWGSCKIKYWPWNIL
jgi:hypothetical protein